MFSLHFFRVIDFFSSLNCVIYVMQGLLIISPEKFGHAKWDFCQLYCASQKYTCVCARPLLNEIGSTTPPLNKFSGIFFSTQYVVTICTACSRGWQQYSM